MTAIRSPHDREILRLALPALGALVAEPLYILADTAVVGHLGTEQLAGLAVAATVLLLAHSIFSFLAYGTTSAVARLLGAGAEREAAHQGIQGVWLAALIGVVLTAVGLVLAPTLIRLLGAEGGVADNALVYLRISLIGLPAILVVLAGTGYLRGLQNTVTPLAVALASAVVNLVLELVLIYGFGFGIGASALSTVVAQFGAAAVYIHWIIRAVRAHDIARRPHWATIGSLARVGRDLFVRTVALRGTITVQIAVAARLGPVALAANQIVLEIWNFLALVLDAIAIAGQALIGRFLGATDVARARAAGRRMLEWGFVSGVVMGAVLAGLHLVLPHLFSNDVEVIEVAGMLLLIAAVIQPVNGVVFALDGLLIGAGDLRYLAVAMILGPLVFVPAAYAVLAYDLSIAWLWWALGLFMVSRLVPLLARWHGGRWAVTGATR